MSECAFPALKPVESRSILPVGFRVESPFSLDGNVGLPVLELLRRAATRLPMDVVEVLVARRNEESPGSRAANTLDTMLDNIALADAHQAPLCQDTGTVIFWVRHPFGVSQRRLRDQIRQAVSEATARSWLRPNCVAALSGKNLGNNLDPFGDGHPVIHLEEWEDKRLEITVMLKGGGCENVGAQYRLPDVGLGAGRDLEGVRRCVIDAVLKAQGQGCSPGILGVAIGGDRVVSYERSKALLLRKVGSDHPDPHLNAFEKRLTSELNTLEIGPMGYGGRTTVLDVFCEELWRHPASFFVSISYMCWSSRRGTLSLGGDGFVAYD